MSMNANVYECPCSGMPNIKVRSGPVQERTDGRCKTTQSQHTLHKPKGTHVMSLQTTHCKTWRTDGLRVQDTNFFATSQRFITEQRFILSGPVQEGRMEGLYCGLLLQHQLTEHATLTCSPQSSFLPRVLLPIVQGWWSSIYSPPARITARHTHTPQSSSAPPPPAWPSRHLPRPSLGSVHSRRAWIDPHWTDPSSSPA